MLSDKCVACIFSYFLDYLIYDRKGSREACRAFDKCIVLSKLLIIFHFRGILLNKIKIPLVTSPETNSLLLEKLYNIVIYNYTLYIILYNINYVRKTLYNICIYALF